MNRAAATLLTLLVVAGAGAVAFVPNAFAANTLDCGSFKNQAAAQTQLRIDYPNDPNVLDKNKNGIACEAFPYADKTHDYTKTGVVDPPPPVTPTVAPPVAGGQTVKPAAPNADRVRTDVPK